LHRSSDVDGADVVSELRQLGNRLAHRGLRRTVEHDSERPLLGVLAHEDDGAPEVRIDEGGACNQELASEGVHGHIIARVERLGREVRLAARPHGLPAAGDFQIAEVQVPDPGEGEVLIRNAYISVDPYMRSRMSEVRSYASSFAVGEPMSGGAVGRVEASCNPRFAEGDWVLHMLGWREWALLDGSGMRTIDPGIAPVTTALGVLGMPGFTAWYGLFEIGAPQEGETVFVSGAAGAVGSAVGQMAGIAGCRVIGSAGSQEKLDWLRELGFDGVFSYREQPPRTALRGLAPDGIDVYFDNVGGDHLEAAIAALRNDGRVVACGSIASYNDTEPRPGPRNVFMVVTKRLRIQGFIISDHYDRFPEFLEQAGAWVREGRLRYRETVVEGIENAPAAFVGLLRGENIGKMLVRVGPEE
jgi:NADPH-dependent curcumin reductase CurA